MTLKDEPGQDVLLFGDKVLEICRRIDGTGMGPKDLVLLCEESFLKSESFELSVDESRLHREVDLNPSKYTYEEIVSQHKSHYRSLLGQVLWNGEKYKGETESPEILLLRE